jgi:hypothetical protein
LSDGGREGRLATMKKTAMRDGQDPVDSADRKATAERMRRGEPAPTADRATVEADLARRILRMWWAPWGWLCLGLVSVPLLLFAHDAVGRILGVMVLLQNVGMAVWRELHRRGAARLLDANQRRWGDV